MRNVRGEGEHPWSWPRDSEPVGRGRNSLWLKLEKQPGNLTFPSTQWKEVFFFFSTIYFRRRHRRAFPSVTQNWHSYFLPEIPLTSYHEKRWLGVRATTVYTKISELLVQVQVAAMVKKQNIKTSPRSRTATGEEFKTAQTGYVDVKSGFWTINHRYRLFTLSRHNLMCLADYSTVNKREWRSPERSDNNNTAAISHECVTETHRHIEAIIWLWAQGAIYSKMCLWRTWQLWGCSSRQPWTDNEKMGPWPQTDERSPTPLTVCRSLSR